MPGLGLLVVQDEAFVTGVKRGPVGVIHRPTRDGLEEMQGAADGVDDGAVGLNIRRMAEKIEVPVLRVMEVGEAPVHQGTHEIERQGGPLVAPQEERGIGIALGGRESRTVHDVAPVAWQRHAVARLGVRAARLRVLSRHAADTRHRHLEAMQQDKAHLQQDLQPTDHCR